MAADSLFWDANMAAVTSYENTLYLIFFLLTIDLLTVFFNFFMDQFGKISRHP